MHANSTQFHIQYITGQKIFCERVLRKLDTVVQLIVQVLKTHTALSITSQERYYSGK